MVILELEPFPSLSILIFRPNIFKSIRRFTTLPSSTKCNFQNPNINIYTPCYIPGDVHQNKGKKKQMNIKYQLPPLLVLSRSKHQSSLYNLIKRILPLLIVSTCEITVEDKRVTFVCPCTSQRDVISFTWADLTYFYMSDMFSPAHNITVFVFSSTQMKPKRKIK